MDEHRPPRVDGGAEHASASPDAVDDGALGVYVHVPFCERVCPYCDFAVVAARPLEPAREARYVAGLLAELAARQAHFAGRPLASLYFGGGTPALCDPASIATLVDAVHEAFPGAAGRVETTLELNPSTVERDRLPGFRDAGIDRLSIGVQSFDDAQLRRLGRAHRSEVVHSTLRSARAAGFDDVSLDLIFAAPEQSIADLDRDLDALIEFGPEHASTYELTFEPETPFGRALAKGRMPAPDEDLAADMIEHVEARLAAAGLERYEISSHARPGHRARHNARYWQRQAVLGLGVGAHSTEARTQDRPHGARRANPRDLATWAERVEAAPAAVGEQEDLSPATARGEAVFLGLRQREGLDAARFAQEFGAPPRAFFAAAIERLVSVGWLVESQHTGDLALSRAGRLMADSAAAEFVGDGAEVGGASTAGGSAGAG